MAPDELADSDDALLMARTGRGGRDAFAALIRRHQRAVLAIAYRFLGDRSEAEDVAQEVFLRLWDAAPRYRPDKPLPAFLRTLTVHLCLDRRRKARPLVLMDELEPTGSQNPEAELNAAERRRALFAALSRLPSAQRMAVVLFHMEGLSVREVAGLLETSPKAVESLLSRARSALRDDLGATLSAQRPAQRAEGFSEPAR
jgi:RNA polymerase sigma-70 factor (ECF subfamily)